LRNLQLVKKMPKKFYDFIDRLSSSEKAQLQDINNQEIQRIQRELKDSIQRDQEHLELVNVCYNACVQSTEFYKLTNYSVRLVDPLYNSGKKIFDLALFGKENSTLILVECKSSVSKREKTKIVDETVEASKVAESKRHDLEIAIGEQIQRMEFAICSYPYYANEIKDTIFSADANLCLWAYHSTPGIIKLVEMSDDVYSEKMACRTHYDEKIRETLLKGIRTRSGSLRSLPIAPSSHMFIKLAYLSQQLFLLMDRKKREERWFKYSDVFTLLKQAIGGTTDLNDKDIEEMTKDTIRSGIDTNLFRDLTEGIEDFDKKEFDLSYSRRDYERFCSDYVARKAQKKAFEPALERFRKETGYKTLNEY